MSKKTVDFNIDFMECASCSTIIEREARKIKGVTEIKADYVKGKGTVTYDTRKTSIDKIFEKIGSKGYECKTKPEQKEGKIKSITLLLGAIVILMGAYVLYENFAGYSMPILDQNTSLLLLFTIGLLTGFHCIAMCGGFVIGYTTKDSGVNLRSHLTYGLSKTASYAIIGAIFGFIGSLITFTPLMRGMAAVLAGAFLILFGLNMLNIFTWFRRFRLKTPGFISKKITGARGRSPMAIGLLNGLMIACGPLQAIYIFAAASGSAYYGALYLAAFGLGTLPVLLGFGVLASVLSSSLTHRIVRYSGVVVILLGLVMLNRGLALTGTGYDVNTVLVSAEAYEDTATASIEPVTLDATGYQEIRMEVTRYGWNPDKFLLKKGVPVRWIIDGKEINGCNNAIQVPKLGLKFDIKPGLQTIEFTPTEEGTIPWSCWMGMIPGVFVVKDDIGVDTPIDAQKELEAVPLTSGGGSCGGGCGGGGCGCGCGG
ncbi:MAG: sulfite exporter TauE/SafE family protein [Candidatus Altiarchaeota archaeon]